MQWTMHMFYCTLILLAWCLYIAYILSHKAQSAAVVTLTILILSAAVAAFRLSDV